MKTCTKCGTEYPATLDYFYKDSRNKSILKSWCRSCLNKGSSDWLKAHPEKAREASRKYANANREKVNKAAREYYWANVEKIRPEMLRRYRANRDGRMEDSRRWKENNQERVRKYTREYYETHHDQQREYNRQPQRKLSRSISSRIWKSLVAGKAGRHWEDLVGYTLADLKTHLESQFTKGMTWDNYGYRGWHIDHIKPVSHFNFTTTDDPEFLECWSLWNLQPLWAHDNFSKRDRCEAPPLPLLHGGNR